VQCEVRVLFLIECALLMKGLCGKRTIVLYGVGNTTYVKSSLLVDGGLRSTC